MIRIIDSEVYAERALARITGDASRRGRADPPVRHELWVQYVLGTMGGEFA
jgi:hypothetical protein